MQLFKEIEASYTLEGLEELHRTLNDVFILLLDTKGENIANPESYEGNTELTFTH